LNSQLSKIRTKVKNASHILKLKRQLGTPDALYYYGGGLGDDLMCAAVLHEMRKRGAKNLWMMSNHKALFQGNPNVDALVPEDTWLFPRLGKFGIRAHDLHWAHYIPSEDRDELVGDGHAIVTMMEVAGVKGEVDVRPYLYLTPEELAAGKVTDRQIVIQSTGASARFAIPNKEWYPQRFQVVVDQLKDRFNFVQLGMPGDDPLSGAMDLRGKTTIRETAAIVARSLVTVSLEGFLMHLARAVDSRAVVVFGGRSLPRQVGYGGFDNIYTQMECSPCWRGVSCPYDRECMNRITVDQVSQAILRQAELNGTSIPLDVVKLS
jgi:hypothetical protein